MRQLQFAIRQQTIVDPNIERGFAPSWQEHIITDPVVQVLRSHELMQSATVLPTIRTPKSGVLQGHFCSLAHKCILLHAHKTTLITSLHESISCEYSF